MAVTTDKSVNVTNAALGKATDSTNDKGEIFPVYVDFTQGAAAGDITSTVDLKTMPPGKWRYVAALSKLYYSAFGASRTLDIGHTGYTEPDGDVIAAAAAAIDSAKDVAAAASYSPGGALTADGTLLINSKTPVLLQGKVAGGTIPAGATIKGILMFMS